jgi:hypothetical protein
MTLIFLWAVGREAADSPNSAASSRAPLSPANPLQGQLHPQLQGDKMYSNKKISVQVRAVFGIGDPGCTGRPACFHASNPPMTSVASVKPISCSRAASRLEE